MEILSAITSCWKHTFHCIAVFSPSWSQEPISRLIGNADISWVKHIACEKKVVHCSWLGDVHKRKNEGVHRALRDTWRRIAKNVFCRELFIWINRDLRKKCQFCVKESRCGRVFHHWFKISKAIFRWDLFFLRSFYVS